MADNDCMDITPLSISVIEFLKYCTASSSFKVFFPMIMSCRITQSVHAYSTTSKLSLIDLESPYYGNIASTCPLLKVWKMPALVVHKVGAVALNLEY